MGRGAPPQVLVTHFRPLHPLLGFPEGVGLQTVPVGITDAIGAIVLGRDREPRWSGDGVAHGRGRQLLTGLLPCLPPSGTVKRLVAAPATHWTPTAGMMERRFNRRDVHRLDRRPSPVADRRSPSCGRRHGSLLHLAIEAIGGALSRWFPAAQARRSPWASTSSLAPSTPGRCENGHPPGGGFHCLRSVGRPPQVEVWRGAPERRRSS
jgi:hypothetical protein